MHAVSSTRSFCFVLFFLFDFLLYFTSFCLEYEKGEKKKGKNEVRKAVVTLEMGY